MKKAVMDHRVALWVVQLSCTCSALTDSSRRKLPFGTAKHAERYKPARQTVKVNN